MSPAAGQSSGASACTVGPRERVSQVFELGAGLTPAEAKGVELGVYNATIDFAEAEGIPRAWSSELFLEAYVARARSVYANLCEESHVGNTQLLARMRGGEFAPHELGTMPRERMFPQRWSAIIEEEALRNQQAFENKPVPRTNMVVCHKCKSKKITYFELQTRSCDEPATLFYTCLACGKRWKN